MTYGANSSAKQWLSSSSEFPNFITLLQESVRLILQFSKFARENIAWRRHHRWEQIIHWQSCWLIGAISTHPQDLSLWSLYSRPISFPYHLSASTCFQSFRLFCNISPELQNVDYGWNKVCIGYRSSQTQRHSPWLQNAVKYLLSPWARNRLHVPF